MSSDYLPLCFWTIEAKLAGSKKGLVKIKSNVEVLPEFRVAMEEVIKEVSDCYPTVELEEFQATAEKTCIEVNISDKEADKNYLLWEVVQRFKILSTQKYLEGMDKSGWAKLEGKLWNDII